MNTKVTFDTIPTTGVVYVKPVATSELPREVQAHANGIETLYSVHNDMGEQLALVADRRMAFVLARQNHLAAVQVH